MKGLVPLSPPRARTRKNQNGEPYDLWILDKDFEVEPWERDEDFNWQAFRVKLPTYGIIDENLLQTT